MQVSVVGPADFMSRVESFTDDQVSAEVDPSTSVVVTDPEGLNQAILAARRNQMRRIFIVGATPEEYQRLVLTPGLPLEHRFLDWHELSDAFGSLRVAEAARVRLAGRGSNT